MRSPPLARASSRRRSSARRARHLLVAEQVHRVVTAPAGHRRQRLRVREELRHRHLGLDRRHSRRRLHAVEPPAARVEIAVDRTDGLVGDGHLELHDRLEQHRVGLRVGLLEGHRAGDLERHLGGVDVVVLPVDELDAHALDRRAGQLAVLHRLLDPLVDRRPVALRDNAADDLVDELVALVALDRLEDDLAVAELAAAAGLLLVAVTRPRLRADRLQVRNARLVELDVDAEATLRALERDLDVHLAHPGEDLLAGLRVAAQPERRILLGEALDRRGDLLLLALDLRRHGEAHHGLGEAERRRLDRDLAIGEQVAGLHVLQLGDGTEVALAEVLRRCRRLALELQQRAHPLLRVLAVVDERRLGRHRRPSARGRG